MVIEAGTSVVIDLAWPRHPVVTRTGRVSKAKTAGKPIAWLSTNVQHGLMSGRPGKPMPPNGRIRIHGYKVQWREAVAEYIKATGRDDLPIEHAVRIEVSLYRWGNAARELDVGAYAEGAKPLVDGLVQAGALRGDGPAYLTAIDRGGVFPCKRGEQKVLLRLRRAA